MPEVMETNLAKVVVVQDSFKAIGEVVGFETLTHLNHADVVKVIFTVGAPAQLTILCLRFTLLEKKNPDCWCMVNAVYVHAPDKSSGHRVQEIEISYNYIGILPASLLQNVQNAKTA